jgi:hypothetical protein
MAATPPTTATPTGLEPTRVWAPCPYCWGQRRIWAPLPAANGEGAVLLARDCPQCLGVGEVLR